MSEILISCEQLKQLLHSNACVPVDCRFDLSRPDRGLQEFLAGHIPGAVYAHLDWHLSSVITSQSGRHPLPEADVFTAFLASIGWQKDQLLIAYDAGSNAFSARLWWLMRYFGLNAALLDGGLAAWKQAGFPIEQGPSAMTAVEQPHLSANEGLTVSATDVLALRRHLTLVDARAPERYSGKVEPIDSVAGHIPGALNRPMGLNLGTDGRFKTPEQLRNEFVSLLDGGAAEDVVHYCGSGVTACHNAFAMELAGLEGSRVYPGSWSEWIRDPARPIETSH